MSTKEKNRGLSYFRMKNTDDLSGFDLKIVEFFADLPGRSKREELLNALTHAVVALLSIPVFFYLIYISLYSNKDHATLSALIYGLSIIVLFFSSSIYHYTDDVYTKKKFRILDHCSIFVFITGNYAPLLLLTIGGSVGWIMLCALLILSFTGIILKIRFTGSYDWFFVSLYVFMAWLGILQVNNLANLLPSTALHLLFWGGMAYMVGIAFYKAESKIPYAHLIWHLFVVLGALLHFFAITNYVIV